MSRVFIEDKFGSCCVNGIILTNVNRYRYAKMKPTLSKRSRRLIEKHLKDCQSCRDIIEKLEKERNVMKETTR
jgi:hypothetical protein